MLNRQHLKCFLLAFVGYLALAKLGIEIATINLYVAAVWPAAGFAFLVSRHCTHASKMGVWAASLTLNYLLGSSIITSAIIAIGTALEMAIAVWIYNRFEKSAPTAPYHLRVTRLLSSGVVACIVASLIGNFGIWLDGRINADNYLFSIFTWAVGDCLGIFVLVPLAYAVKQRWNTSTNRALHLTLAALIVAASALVAYYGAYSVLSHYLIFAFLILLLFIGVFLHPLIAYSAAIGFYISAIYMGRLGVGLHMGATANIGLIHLQVTFAAISLTLIVIEDFFHKKVRRKTIGIMAFFLTLSMVSNSSLLNLLEDQKNTEVREQFNITRNALAARFEVYAAAMKTMVAHVALNPDPCIPGWQEFAEKSELISRYAGLNGVGIIYPMKREDTESWLKERQTKCKSSMVQVHDVPNVERTATPERFVITKVYPREKNVQAYGLDVASEQNRYEAALKARATNMMTITKPVVLVQDEKREPAYLLFAPIRNKDRFIGWVYAPIIWPQFFQSSITQLPRGQGYSIVVNDDDGDGTVYRTHKHFENLKIFTSDNLRAFDQTLTINWFIDPALVNPKDWLAVWVAFLLASVSLMLAIIAANMEQLAERATAIAKDRSEALVSYAKMITLGELSSNIAHEVNNPLGILKGLLTILRIEAIDNKSDETILKPVFERIESTVNRLSRIIQSMQILSRDGSGAPKTRLNLEKPVNVCVELVEEKFRKTGIELMLKLDPKAVIIGNENEISQVVANLLNNAYDAIKDLPKRWISIETQAFPTHIQLSLTDSGPGIPEHIARKIMQPWFTTKTFNQGSGLGLSISQKIVQAHNGTLELDATDAHTRFVLKFPLPA